MELTTCRSSNAMAAAVLSHPQRSGLLSAQVTTGTLALR